MPQQAQPQIPGSDVLLDTLRNSKITDDQRQEIWDAYHTPGDEKVFVGALNKLNYLPDDAKQFLYDVRFKGFRNPPRTQVPAPQTTQGPVSGGLVGPPGKTSIGPQPQKDWWDKLKDVFAPTIYNVTRGPEETPEEKLLSLRQLATPGTRTAGFLGAAEEMTSPESMTYFALPEARLISAAFAAQGLYGAAKGGMDIGRLEYMRDLAKQQGDAETANRLDAEIREAQGRVGLSSLVTGLAGTHAVHGRAETEVAPEFKGKSAPIQIQENAGRLTGQTPDMPRLTFEFNAPVEARAESTTVPTAPVRPRPFDFRGAQGPSIEGIRPQDVPEGRTIGMLPLEPNEFVAPTPKPEATPFNQLSPEELSKATGLTVRPVMAGDPASPLMFEKPELVGKGLQVTISRNKLVDASQVQQALEAKIGEVKPIEVAPPTKGPEPISIDLPNQVRYRINQAAERGTKTEISPGQQIAADKRLSKLNEEIDSMAAGHLNQLNPAQLFELRDKLRAEAETNLSQADVVDQVRMQHPTAKAAREAMSEGRPVKLPVGVGEQFSAKGTPISIVDTMPFDARRVLHELLGDESKQKFDEIALGQREKLREKGIDPDQAVKEQTEVQQAARAELMQLRDEVRDKAMKIAQEAKEKSPGKALEIGEEEFLKQEQGKALARLLKEPAEEGGKSLNDRIRQLRAIVDRDPSRLVFRKRGAPVEEAGVVKPAGVIGEKTLELANRIWKRKLRNIPSDAEWQAKAQEFRNKGNLLKRIADKIAEKLGGDERGFVGEQRKSSRQISPERLVEMAKSERYNAYEITDEHPAKERGWLSKDGKYWIDVHPEDVHDMVASSILHEDNLETAYDTMRQNWIRKAGFNNYDIGGSPLTSSILRTIEMDVIKGKGTEDTVYIDAADAPRGGYEINPGKNFEREVAKQKVTPYSLSEAGRVPSPVLPTGIAAGAGIGYAVGGPVGGVAGAIIGAAVSGAAFHPIVRAVVDSLGREIKSLALDAGQSIKQVGENLTHFLAPKIGVGREALGLVYRMKGDIARANYEAARVLDAYRKAIDNLPRQAQIEFIDRMKTGRPQATPELQELAETIRKIDKDDYDSIKLFRPTLPFLENHFRLLYKTLPGGTDNAFKGWLGKRPLAGSQGMLNQHVYDTLSDAMAAGGKPITTDPIELFLIGHADAQRFVHSNMMWEEAKYLGLREFVRMGEKAPDGFTRLDDRIAKVYFPAASGEGLVHSGNWYVEQGFGRLLDNYLSNDRLRQNIVGKKLIDFKNATTGWELFGPFHAVAINLAAISQNFSLGLQRALGGDIGGVKQMAEAPLELLRGNYGLYREGKDLQGLGDAIAKHKIGDPVALNDFIQSEAGQRLLKQYPNADNLLTDAFHGGLNMKISDDIRSNVVRSGMENFRNNEYLQGSAKLPAMALRKIMDPLFDTYIPRIKLSMFMRDMTTQLKAHAGDIISGKITRDQLARQVTDRIENIFGEMNYDNLFWNKSFKTSLQLLYRSVTWRFGTLRLLATAMGGQVADLRQGRLNPNFGFLLSEGLMIGLTSAVIMRALAGKNPSSMSDLLHPQTGDKDQHGKPVRINVPGYMSRDIPHILGSPTGVLSYIGGGQSAVIQRALESWNNKDFSGAWITNPNDPEYKQWTARFMHLLPGIMMFNTMDRLDAEGANHERKVLALFGFTPAPKSIDMTPAELMAQQKMVETLPRGGRDPQAIQKSIAMGRIIAGIQNRRPNVRDEIRRYAQDGTINSKDIDAIVNRIRTPYLAQLLERQKLPDVLSVFKVANPQEQQILKALVVQKMGELQTMRPEDRTKTVDMIKEILAQQGAQNKSGASDGWHQ